MLLIVSTITLFNKEQSSKDKDSKDLNNKSDIEPNINISSDKGEFLSEEEIKKLQGE